MCSSAARRTICARVLSRASRVERYNVSKASSCSGLRVGIRIGFMGSSFSHKPTPLGNNLIVLKWLLLGSCPQLPHAALGSSQQPVDVEAIGVGRYLRRDPGGQPSERLGQGAVHPEGALERRKAYLHLLPRRWAPVCPLRCQHDAAAGENLLERLRAVGEVRKESARCGTLESGCIQELLHQEHVRCAGGGKLVGEGNAGGCAQEVQLHAVDRERAPSNSRSSEEALRLSNLARMQDLRQ